jgi:hypothetical protein
VMKVSINKAEIKITKIIIDSLLDIRLLVFNNE